MRRSTRHRSNVEAKETYYIGKRDLVSWAYHEKQDRTRAKARTSHVKRDLVHVKRDLVHDVPSAT